MAATGVPEGRRGAYRWQVFATEGLQLPIWLHATAAPEASFGHGTAALHAK